MKVTQVETFFCEAGWRPWIFVKITTDTGPIGWSEVTDSHGSPLGLKGCIETLAKKTVIGSDPRNINAIFWDLYRHTRQTPGGLIQKAIAAIENALWDIKAKDLGVPVYELFGGKVRDKIELYWSHCATTRVRASHHVGQPAINNLDDLGRFCSDVVTKSGYTACKANIFDFTGDSPQVYMPGFQGPAGTVERNPSKHILKCIDIQLKTMREALGSDFGICLDLNFNFNLEGCQRVLEIVEKYDLLWLEMDHFDPKALEKITHSTSVCVASGENLYGLRQFEPFLQDHSMNVALIDVIWNGMIESRKIAEMAEIHETNLAPHNYYSHLSTLISAQFCITTPNLRIMEVDVDDVPWREELITDIPSIENGYLELSNKPGWGADINEEVLRKHEWHG